MRQAALCARSEAGEPARRVVAIMTTWLDSIREKLDEAVCEKARVEEEEGRDPADVILKGEHMPPGELLHTHHPGRVLC